VSNLVAEKIDQIAAEFADLEPRERLELLLEFAEKLPPLPQRFLAERDAGLGRVQECQTPVFLFVELQDGQVQVFADVAPEAPTVKGFVSVLTDICSGSSTDDVLTLEPTVVHRLGLTEALGMVRMRGLQAVAQRIRQKVAQAIAA
jgi:cysteine desulfuration protein SufE